jgi:hypothetical protein
MIFRDVILMFPLRRVGAPVGLEEGGLQRVELACPFSANDCSIACFLVPLPSLHLHHASYVITAATADVGVTGPSLRTYNGYCIHVGLIIYKFGSLLAVVLIFFSEVHHRS